MKSLWNLLTDRIHTLPLMVLYLTDGCNSKCVTCDIWKNPRRNMSMELVENLALTCRKLEVQWVLLSGGEAMQHPEWPAIARRFQAEGVYVMLLTNGLLLKKQIHEVLTSVNEVIVSLDGGNAETYAQIRGVNAFDLVMEGIRAVRAGGLPVTTRTTVQRANYREIPQIIEVALEADVNLISFLTVDVSNPFAFGPRFESDVTLMPHHPPVEALTPDDIDELELILDSVNTRFTAAFASGRMAEPPEKLRRMVTYFRAITGQGDFDPPRCNAPHISTVIQVDGTLQPCYFLPAWGKLNGRNLPEALNDEEAVALRKTYSAGQRPECKSCVCPLYKGPRSLLRMGN
ncbi:MAG: radical SAM protein [Anaerolineae bacterium]|nr:radical SAM protein [Anaerolineae bacterium]